MTDIAILHDLIEPEVVAMGFALVRVAWVKGEGEEPTLQVMAERSDTRQLVLDDCVALSRRISRKFDALEEAGRDPVGHAYRLEVSSPGIDRPLTRFADFADWEGHEAKLELTRPVDGQKRFRGCLAGVSGDDEVVFDDREGTRRRFAFASIADAKLVLTDRLVAATAPLDMEGAESFETVYDDEPGAEEPLDKEEQD